MKTPTYTSGVLQVKAYRILQESVSKTLEQFHINPTEWSILGQIYENKNGVRFSEIAKTLNVEAPLITMMVNQLDKKGLIERHGHPTDSRAKLLFLTSKGKAQIPVIEKVLKETLFTLLKGVTNEDLHSYQKVLEAIIANSQKA